MNRSGDSSTCSVLANAGEPICGSPFASWVVIGKSAAKLVEALIQAIVVFVKALACIILDAALTVFGVILDGALTVVTGGTPVGTTTVAPFNRVRLVSEKTLETKITRSV